MEQIGLRWRQIRFNPLRSLTPERLASALDSHAAGWLREAALIFETIEQREAIVRSVMTKRRAAVARRDWQIMIPDPDDPRAEAHKETLEHFYNNLTVTDATDLNVRTGMSGLLRQMMDAIIQRYAVHEIIWKPGPDGLTAELRRVPIYFFENRSGRLRFTGPENRADGIPLDENGWMITVAEGLGEALSICWMFKRLGIQDLLAFSEKFSVPGVLGRTSAKADSDEGRAMRDSVLAYASEWVGVIYGDDGAVKDPVQIIQTPGGGTNLPPMTIAEYFDRMIATLVRGGDLSTISRKDSTGSNPQDDETAALLEDDCALVSETLQTQLDRMVIRMVHGDETPAAYIVINPPDTTDNARELIIDEGLARMGVKQRPEDLAERYGREAVEEEEDLNRQDAKDAKGREGEEDAKVAENYNPMQARDPAGTRSGGRWTSLKKNPAKINFGSSTSEVVQSYLEEQKQQWVDGSMQSMTSGPTETEDGKWEVSLADDSTETFDTEEDAQARLDSEREWFESATITIDEDGAYITDDNQNEVLRIVKKNGVWQDVYGNDISGIDQESAEITDEDRTKATKLFSGMPVETVDVRPTEGGFAFVGNTGGSEPYEIVGSVSDDVLQIKTMLPKDGTASFSGTSRGVGLLIATVESAKDAGLSRITTTGGKGGATRMTGYRTWSALGFDAPLPSSVLPDEIKHLAGDPPTLLHLTSTREGRLWWRTNGHSVDMSFDLAEGSESAKRLEQVKGMLSR